MSVGKGLERDDLDVRSTRFDHPTRAQAGCIQRRFAVGTIRTIGTIGSVMKEATSAAQEVREWCKGESIARTSTWAIFRATLCGRDLALSTHTQLVRWLAVHSGTEKRTKEQPTNTRKSKERAVMGTQHDIRKNINEAIDDLEQLADDVRVKIHLANMDAKEVWNQKLEPRLLEARRHAKEATVASQAAVEETVKAFREFAHSL